MNENFVNIKIDREERPDLDHIYMDAVQALTGSGGWPLNVFLTPDAKPFYGGTYFPPRRAFNRPSWQEVLQSISELFRDQRSEVDAQAQNLTGHLLQSNSFGIRTPNKSSEVVTEDRTDIEMFNNIMKTADREWGGFGSAPKFPQTFTIQFLLRYHFVTKTDEALQQALLSLDKMIQGGIYDQVGGGFARYATDGEWLAPHFEKMLYDNALLVAVLSEAFQLTKRDRYREVIDETMNFIRRELMHPEFGFYSALDADSEGEEGKFYVWDINEVSDLLGDDADLFCRYFDISEKGNWEGKNILRAKESVQDFAIKNGISAETLKALLETGKKQLLAARGKRIRPQLDDKIILGWNALMNTACSKAYMSTGNEVYRQLAVDNMQFLLRKFCVEGSNDFHHTWKSDLAKYPAFLDDYAFLIEAMLYLQEITADTDWLLRAEKIAGHVVDNFSEEGTDLLCYTQKGQTDVIMRKREIYDGAVPSGNSVMTYNLYRLSIFFDKKSWKQRSMKVVDAVKNVVSSYPTSFGVWASLLLELKNGTAEIAIVGKGFRKLQDELFNLYLPHKVLMSTDFEREEFPLLSGKKTDGNPMFFLCKDFACQQPVTSIDRFMLLINRH